MIRMSEKDEVINYKREIKSNIWIGGHRCGYYIEIEEEVISTRIEKKTRQDDSEPWNTNKGEMIEIERVIIQIQA